ncbi:hypothetical protein B0A49_13823, partial [Cryomyces minteri]
AVAVTVLVTALAVDVTVRVDVGTARQEHALEMRRAGYDMDDSWVIHLGAGAGVAALASRFTGFAVMTLVMVTVPVDVTVTLYE